MTSSGVRGFDFLIGSWDVANRRLRERLAGSTDWEEFPATAICRRILGGTANIDEISFPTRGYTGSTLRLFNAEREEWSLHWSSSLTGRLEPPVVGRFIDGVGDFFGDDRHEETPIRVHYRWSRITPTSARWEQAFSTDQESSWERNWIMDFTRVVDTVTPAA